VRQLASLLPQLPGIDSPKTYAAWPVWAGSTTAELRWPTVVKEAIIRWYHRARAWNAAKQAVRRYGGTLGSACMRVLESFIFDFQNYRTGRLDPSYEGIAAKTGLSRSTVAVALARLKSLRIIHWVRRCEHHWNNDRFELRQLTNAYVLLPPSQWLGLDPAPAEVPAPETGTWGDHPPLPDLLDQAITERRNGGSVDSALSIIEQDETDLLARSTARLFRTVLANENADKPLNCSGVQNSD